MIILLPPHLEALGLELPAGVEDALVLRLRGDDVPPLRLVEPRHALHGDVVRLRRARREHDLLRVGADQGTDLAPAMGMALK